jgi:hypothetical protein
MNRVYCRVIWQKSTNGSEATTAAVFILLGYFLWVIYEAVNISKCITLSGRVSRDGWDGKDYEGIGRRLIQVLSEICLAGLRKTTKRCHVSCDPAENGAKNFTSKGL